MMRYNKILGGILLVAGTTIGAGMLALPVSTGLAGFIPSLVLLFGCWLFMTYTAFLMLEVNLWMDSNTNLISMAKKTLGRGGEIISWITYLFLLYALTTAYIAGSGPLTISVVKTLTGFVIPSYAGSIPLLLLFGFFVYKGTAAVDYANRLLMLGLMITYAIMILFLFPHVDNQMLRFADWPAVTIAVSLVVTSFGFHIIIPSLSTYLQRDVAQLKFVIIVGSIIPLIVYLIWVVLILGILPLEGQHGLLNGYEQGIDGAQLLSAHMNSHWLSTVASFFSFFAIVTSFLGVSLSLSDFLADGLKIKKTRTGRFGLYLLTFVPPVVFTLTDPRAFFTALEYAGAFGVIVLLGLLPALMVWRGRYCQKINAPYRAPGGKLVLLAVMAIALTVIGLEVFYLFE